MQKLDILQQKLNKKIIQTNKTEIMESKETLVSMKEYYLHKLQKHVSGLFVEEKDYPSYSELIEKIKVDLFYLEKIQNDLHN